MKRKLYSFRKTKVEFNRGYYEVRYDWKITTKEKQASKAQQGMLKWLEWGTDKELSINGANMVIRSILETEDD